jgi:hypothetical protein
MYRIYHDTKRVIVWLGKESKPIKAAFRWIPLMFTEMKKVEDDKKISKLEKIARSHEILKHNREVALSYLFEREWFHRL